MKESPSKQFDYILHPFVFILKEGAEINDNFLDYSLLLLQMNQVVTIRSPQPHKNSSPLVQLLKS